MRRIGWNNLLSWKGLRLVRLCGAVCLATFPTTTFAANRQVGVLPAGKFFWEPELAPSGPLVMIIDLPDQTLSAYRNGVRIAYSSISSGTNRRRTPAGVFTILEKEVTHFSNRYNHAPMPFMQRLTWEGVALHGGDLPGYPASHGCIRLPRNFAKRLYSITTRGTTVIVVDEKRPEPTIAAHPGILLSPTGSSEDFSGSVNGEFEWSPERSPDGPITILASGADKTIYVYRNGIPIGRAPFEIDNPRKRLGGHAFTMLEGIGENPSSFVPDRPAHRWMAVRTEGTTTLEEIGRRVHVSPAFAEKVYDLVEPGTTIVVTDAPALRPSRSAYAVFRMEAAKK
ncbi:MAG TPA: L,D-transpeptidase [Chthoniobacterales bacterium]|nr:L,D-transpeptidase [Chthoniobacterales bacterium]